ncbi:ABC transporter permease [Consotaella aegiceratis]|uniref:ABC transporter permease n=1 Tax=Consotaella aegiceratis TaxID=3097961 RepID=UPI002F40D14D
MNIEFLLAAAFVSATPIIFAALGELLIERAGILNLGIEGTMLIGAVTGFTAASLSGSPVVGIAAAVAAGGLWGAIFAAAVVTLRLDQVVTGLAFTILGTGISSFIGEGFVGKTLSAKLPDIDLGVLEDMPFFGPVLFSQDPLVLASLVLVGLVSVFLWKTRAGLILRTLGESPQALDALGQPVAGLRFLYSIVGSGFIALGGAYLSVVFTPSWVENMTAGRGWIALGIVIFAGWRPSWIALGAALFGIIDAYRFRAQIGGEPWIDPHFLNMLPYVVILVVLGMTSSGAGRRRLFAPAALGRPYDRERR